MSDYCNITNPAHDKSCAAPPGGMRWETTRLACFRCGLPVCGPCSRLIAYHGHRCRICNNCVEEMESDAARKARR